MHDTNAPFIIAELPALAGKVGLSMCPGKRHRGIERTHERDLDVDLEVVKAWGADVVVTLLEDHEFRMLGVQRLARAVRQAGMRWVHTPIPDMGVPGPEFYRAWRRCLGNLVDTLADGGRVFVHCRGGLGRAGSVSAVLLVKCGECTAGEAVTRVRTVRPGSIQTKAQRGWVMSHRKVIRSLCT